MLQMTLDKRLKKVCAFPIVTLYLCVVNTQQLNRLRCERAEETRCCSELGWRENIEDERQMVAGLPRSP